MWPVTFGLKRFVSSADVTKKITRILELIKNEGQSRKRGGKSWKRESELVTLVQDLHKQYQSLYVLYEQLKQEQGRSDHGGSRKTHPPSPSGSDVSEYFSSDEIEGISGLNSDIVNEEGINLKDLLDLATKERETLSAQYTEALRKIEEAESLMKDLRSEADERKREVSILSEKNRHLEAEASARTMVLEDELMGVKSELKSLQQNRRRLNGQLESRATKAKELSEENKGLRARISELDLMLKNKGEEFSDLLKNLQDTENNRSCKVAQLTAQVHELQQEVESMRDQKCKLEEKMQSLRNENAFREKEFDEKMESLRNELVAREKELDEKIEVPGKERAALQEELDDLRKEIQSLVSELEGKKNEISENLIEIERLQEELARKNKEEQGVLEEKKFLAQQVEDLKLKVSSLSDHEHELEEKLREKSDETDRLREEKEEFGAKVIELERLLTERENEVTSLQDTLRSEGNANSTQISGMKIEIESLQQELNSLEAQKSRLELNNRREEEESSRRMSLLENENMQLTNMIQDLQSKMNEPGGPSGRLISKNSSNQVKNSPRSLKLDPCSVEKKIEELAVEYRMNLEDNIRILCQRILVLEQLHIENKESYKTAKERFQEEYKCLEEKISFYKNEMKKMMEASMTANNTITELDLLVRKSDENSRNIMNRVSKVSKEIQLMKDWFSQVNRHTDSRNVQEETKVRDSQNLEEVKKLEKKVVDLEGIVRERDTGLVALGEEKREAIRQLCVLIEYQRGRCEYFKEVISKITVKRKK
ncbi:hypothetical protein CDL15_Pgr028037 [Punica granatum]|uniref:NAB domain-containing protein n=1 Tax=Punica granatum TaxID=22663 RepID=A0A218XKD3_PUNGR|nr:hypothetical protein CDL15_Pgr028037 [Punica granatum]